MGSVFPIGNSGQGDPRQRPVACWDCGNALPPDQKAKVKLCGGCFVYKDRSAFSAIRSRSSGLNTYCRPCHHGLRRALHRADPRKNRARANLRYAVKAGKVERKPCEVCGAESAEAHHDDYDRQLDVRWLCRPCHVQEHRRLNREKRGASDAGSPIANRSARSKQ